MQEVLSATEDGGGKKKRLSDSNPPSVLMTAATVHEHYIQMQEYPPTHATLCSLETSTFSTEEKPPAPHILFSHRNAGFEI